MRSSAGILTATVLLYVAILVLGLSGGGKNDSEDETTKDESLLKEIISDLKDGRIDSAEKKMKILRNRTKTTDPSELFPTMSFPVSHTEVVDMLEREIRLLSEAPIAEVPFTLVFPWGADFFKTNQDSFRHALEIFEEFNFIPESLSTDVIREKKKVIINFSPTPVYGTPMNTVINYRRNSLAEDQMYFLPELSYMAEALFLFIKRELRCRSVAVLHPKERVSSASKMKNVGWMFGISVPIMIEYEGLDMIPFFREKGRQILKSKNDQEVLSGMSKIFENIRCVIILDGPRNSAAIIPQFRFIGSKELIFIGFFWYRIKDIVDRTYYGSIFYADTVDEGNVDRLRTYMHELKRLSELLWNEPQMRAGKIELQYDNVKISVLPGRHTTRTIFVFRVGREVEKVFEYFKDEPAVQDM